MTLKQKLQAIIDKNGYATSYMKNMMYAIEKAENNVEGYVIAKDKVRHYWENKTFKNHYKQSYWEVIDWYIEHCIGELVLLNNFQGWLDLNI